MQEAQEPSHALKQQEEGGMDTSYKGLEHVAAILADAKAMNRYSTYKRNPSKDGRAKVRGIRRARHTGTILTEN